ncbi:FAD-binding protein [Dankookia sp. P2]|uniref:FAD-binding protein n=1 Tax=Dankookia sp. P2 TaxID=3423955 RepID=UPI003D673C53
MAAGQGREVAPIWGQQAFKIDGRFKFWGGLTVCAWGGGPGLVQAETEAAKKRGIEIRYATRAQKILYDGFKVEGIQVKSPGRIYDIKAPSVILAAGGFQGDAEMRTRYLGPGWQAPKCAAPASTPATASRWRSTSAPPLRQLLRLPCGAVGLQRAGIRRPGGGRRLPEAQLSLVRADQRPWQAVPG